LNTVPNLRCPTDETLAIFAAGNIDPETRAKVLAHIEGCRECLSGVLSATAHLQEERSAQGNSRWWIGAVAAAAIVAAVTVPLVRHEQPSMGKLVAFAPKSERAIELRLSGGFAWAPYRGPSRSANAPVDVARLKLGGAAGEVIERGESDRSVQAQHDAGVAMVLVEKPEEAAARLEKVARASNDAQTWSDLAVARYATAVRDRDASRFPLALAAADQALRIDARLPEALFNRALILDRMGLSAEARRAWGRYLEVDATSGWAAEARQRLAR
jgi:tetratricopeptide (TPR) repeat protein